MKENDEVITLTPSEKETLLLICSNLRAKEIAEKRCLDFETIQGHCKAIRKAAKCNQMPAAVFRIMAKGMLTEAEVQQALNAGY